MWKLKYFYSNWIDYRYFDQMDNGHRFVVLVAFGFLYEMLSGEIVRLQCKLLKHKWVDLSTCTPDYGDINLECKRCGMGSKKILY